MSAFLLSIYFLSPVFIECLRLFSMNFYVFIIDHFIK